MRELIYKTINEINSHLPEEQQLEKSLETVIYGKESKLDSLGLINLIVAIEQNIEDEFNISLTLADERAMSQKQSPFSTVETLADYIEMRIKESKSD